MSFRWSSGLIHHQQQHHHCLTLARRRCLRLLHVASDRTHPLTTGVVQINQNPLLQLPDTVSIAPMMGYTTFPFMLMARVLSATTVLYTEMYHARAIIAKLSNKSNAYSGGGGNAAADLQTLRLCQPPTLFLSAESSSQADSDSGSAPARYAVFQIGTDSPSEAAEAVRLLSTLGWRRFNLNVGCPSDRVSNHGHFGAALMKEPELVAAIADAATNETAKFIDGLGEFSIKCRIGVDDLDSYEYLKSFVGTVTKNAPVKHFVIHARKAWLTGLSPAMNRVVPPLEYERVYRLIHDFKAHNGIKFSLNGGVQSIQEIKDHISKGAHGVMIGRKAKDDLWMFSKIDHEIKGHAPFSLSRRETIEKYIDLAYKDQHMMSHSPKSLMDPALLIYSGSRVASRILRSYMDEHQKSDLRDWPSFLRKALDTLPSNCDSNEDVDPSLSAHSMRAVFSATNTSSAPLHPPARKVSSRSRLAALIGNDSSLDVRSSDMHVDRLEQTQGKR